jgi:hypothetical protein
MVLMLLVGPSAWAGGYDVSGFAHFYNQLSGSADSNLEYLRQRCDARKNPLDFGKNIPQAFGVALRDLSGRRLYKIIPLHEKVLFHSPEGVTKRITYLSLESGRPRIISRVILVNNRWAHENVVRIRWYDSENPDETKSVTVTAILPVGNRFNLGPARDSYDVCLNLYALSTSIGADQAIGPAPVPGPKIHIDISR